MTHLNGTAVTEPTTTTEPDDNGVYISGGGGFDESFLTQGSALWHRDDLRREAIVTQAIVLGLPRPRFEMFPGYDRDAALDADFSGVINSAMSLFLGCDNHPIAHAEAIYDFGRWMLWLGMTRAWAQLSREVRFPADLFPPQHAPTRHANGRVSSPFPEDR